MRLILLRHGERDSGFGDASLSAEGHAQAQRLAADPAFTNVDQILCSPKIRTQQTVTPLAKQRGLEITIENDLDQRKSIETHMEFVNRAVGLVTRIEMQRPGQNLLLCSHSDWLHSLVLNLGIDHPHIEGLSLFGCAEYRILTKKEQRWDIQ